VDLKFVGETERKTVSGQDGERDRKLQLCGWLLFVLSAAFFIATSIRSGDMLALIGGVLFFVACIVFLIPFFRQRRL
jgi:F0F1-type ATP synthase assembly protein I